MVKEGIVKDGLIDEFRAMLESGRCRGNVRGIEHRVWGMECGGLQHRGRDLASIYVLHPCQRTRLSLISGKTKQGDRRGLYC